MTTTLRRATDRVGPGMGGRASAASPRRKLTLRPRRWRRTAGGCRMAVEKPYVFGTQGKVSLVDLFGDAAS
jgi:hypothetical protein